MKLAVMQPYFFPYIGYFQLLDSVDLFVSYDDVNFIKQGWINRNFILMQCRALRITAPVEKASSFRTIAETRLAEGPLWRKEMLKTIGQAYAGAPYFEQVFSLVETVVLAPHDSVAELALSSVHAVAEYLGLAVCIQPSARPYNNRSLKGEARILDICRREEADSYYNLPGGERLYDRANFIASGVKLFFLQPRLPRYKQYRCEFVSQLSVLDVLMFNDRATARGFVASYEVS
jgi:hypothetical protein